jgi:hypothetical protein
MVVLGFGGIESPHFINGIFQVLSTTTNADINVGVVFAIGQMSMIRLFKICKQSKVLKNWIVRIINMLYN